MRLLDFLKGEPTETRASPQGVVKRKVLQVTAQALTKEQQAELAEMVAEGATLSEAAQAFGVSERTISRYRNRPGLRAGQALDDDEAEVPDGAQQLRQARLRLELKKVELQEKRLASDPDYQEEILTGGPKKRVLDVTILAEARDHWRKEGLELQPANTLTSLDTEVRRLQRENTNLTRDVERLKAGGSRLESIIERFAPFALAIMATKGGQGADAAAQIQQAMVIASAMSGDGDSEMGAGATPMLPSPTRSEQGDGTVNQAEAMLTAFVKMKPEQAAGMFVRYAQRGGMIAEGLTAGDAIPMLLAPATVEELALFVEGMPEFPLASKLVALARGNAPWVEAWLTELRRLDDLANQDGAA